MCWLHQTSSAIFCAFFFVSLPAGFAAPTTSTSPSLAGSATVPAATAALPLFPVNVTVNATSPTTPLDVNSFKRDLEAGYVKVFKKFGDSVQLFSIDVMFSDKPDFAPPATPSEPKITSIDMMFLVPPASPSSPDSHVDPPSPSIGRELHAQRSWVSRKGSWVVRFAKKGQLLANTRQFFLGFLFSMTLAKAWQIAIETNYVDWWDYAQVLQYRDRKAPVYRFGWYDDKEEGDRICEIDTELRDPHCWFEPLKFGDDNGVGSEGNVTEVATT